MEAMLEEGLVERIPGRNDFWRLTPRIVEVARQTDIEFVQLRQRVAEHESRYSRITQLGE
ncbi:MAG: hypothetical protein VB131_09255 [Burkholderia gladioli]